MVGRAPARCTRTPTQPGPARSPGWSQRPQVLLRIVFSVPSCSPMPPREALSGSHITPPSSQHPAVVTSPRCCHIACSPRGVPSAPARTAESARPSSNGTPRLHRQDRSFRSLLWQARSPRPPAIARLSQPRRPRGRQPTSMACTDLRPVLILRAPCLRSGRPELDVALYLRAPLTSHRAGLGAVG
jgi:hypothetical protein